MPFEIGLDDEESEEMSFLAIMMYKETMLPRCHGYHFLNEP